LSGGEIVAVDAAACGANQFVPGVNLEHAGIVTGMLCAGAIRYCFVSRLEIFSAPMLLGWQRREKFLCGGWKTTRISCIHRGFSAVK